MHTSAKAVNPIKMYEFFSVGKPVISTAWEELEAIESPCRIAHRPEEFIEMVKQQTAPSTSTAEDLHRFAQENTWERRFGFLMELFEKSDREISNYKF